MCSLESRVCKIYTPALLAKLVHTNLLAIIASPAASQPVRLFVLSQRFLTHSLAKKCIRTQQGSLCLSCYRLFLHTFDVTTAATLPSRSQPKKAFTPSFYISRGGVPHPWGVFYPGWKILDPSGNSWPFGSYFIWDFKRMQEKKSFSVCLSVCLSV